MERSSEFVNVQTIVNAVEGTIVLAFEQSVHFDFVLHHLSKYSISIFWQFRSKIYQHCININSPTHIGANVNPHVFIKFSINKLIIHLH
mmetsp:Transcript_17237/g.35956  ORF Transcript_17237/g.35956 Transcript_17237/m.35956 type:complete len:89 (-) Transcript_17237:32-298(-)